MGHGKWKYDSVNINPRPGDFIMLGANSIATNDWSQALIIKFNTEDALGHNYNFHRAVEGDVIKLGYELGAEVSYAEFQVTPGGNGSFGITRLLSHEGTARSDWRYDVEHFSSFDPAGVATQTYVDAGDQGVKDYVDDRINAIPEYADTLLDSLRGAEYEVRYTNATPSEGSSLVCIDDADKKITASSVLTFTYTPFNRPEMHHASGDGWTHNFLDSFPILSIFSTTRHSRICQHQLRYLALDITQRTSRSTYQAGLLMAIK